MSNEDKFKELERVTRQLIEKGEEYLSSDGQFCAFCGKERSEVDRMWAGPGGSVYICNECVMVCYEMLQEDG